MAELVSVITPTANRSKFLPKLYYSFCHQVYEKKELLVLDDSAQPDLRFIALTKDDKRVKYFHQSTHLSIGGKRNKLIREASGTIIAHFDDDDYYTPNYLSRMVDALGDAQLVQLSCWYNYGEMQKTVGYYNSMAEDSLAYVISPTQSEIKRHPLKLDDRNIWGYGFSYVYRRDMALKKPFPDRDHGEDYQFVHSWKEDGVQLSRIFDASLCLHIVHFLNTSYVCAQEIYGEEKLVELFGDDYKNYQASTYPDNFVQLPLIVTNKIAEVALCMIVRDEEPVIARGLLSAKPLIDYWCICDTGSTDKTREIIRETLAGIPGELHDRPWVNFAHNRNEGLEFLRGKAKYALILDADDIFVLPTNYKLPPLDQDGYRLEVALRNTRYYRLHLIRTDLDYHYESELHELLVSATPKREVVLSGLLYQCLTGGIRSRTPDKFLKDAKKLEELLEKDPTNTRHAFYLAMSLQNAGQIDKAIEACHRVVAMDPPRPLGVWLSEQASHCLLQIARLLEQSNASEAAVIDAYLKAYEARPVRAEPLYYLCWYLRSRGRYRAAAPFAKLGATIPVPNTTFFVEIDIYEWRMKEEYAISLSWLYGEAEGIEIYDQLLRSGKIPASEHDRVFADMRNCYKAFAPSNA